jgi:hypothetical protein
MSLLFLEESGELLYQLFENINTRIPISFVQDAVMESVLSQ